MPGSAASPISSGPAHRPARLGITVACMSARARGRTLLIRLDGRDNGASGANVMAGLQHTLRKRARSATDSPSRCPRRRGRTRCKFWVSAHHGVGKLTAPSARPLQSRHVVSGGQNHGGVYTINFTGDSSGQLITVSYILDSALSPTTPARIRSAAAARTTTRTSSSTRRPSTTAPRRPHPTSRSAPRARARAVATPLSVQQGQNNVPSTVPVTLAEWRRERRDDRRREPVRPRRHGNDRGIRDDLGDGERQRVCRGGPRQLHRHAPWRRRRRRSRRDHLCDRASSRSRRRAVADECL